MAEYRASRFSEGDQIKVLRPLTTGWMGSGTVIEQRDQLVYFWREAKASESFKRSNRQRCVCCRSECEPLANTRPERVHESGGGQC